MKYRLKVFGLLSPVFILILASWIGYNDTRATFSNEYVASLEPGCIAANEWVLMRSSELPRSYDEFVRFPVSYQRAIFKNLSPKEKASLFNSNIDSQLDNLASSEREFALRIRSKIAASLFSIPPEDIEDMDSHFVSHGLPTTREIVNNLGLDTAFNLFASLPVENSYLDMLAVPEDCGCSQSGDFCSVRGHNLECGGSGGCEGSDGGCGWLWLQDCNGECQSTL